MRVLRFILIVFASLLVLVAGFYIWAIQPNQGKQHHRTIRTVGEYSRPSDADSSFSVMTFNIGYLSGMTNNIAVTRDAELFRENLERSRELLRKLSPDIIGFQEIDYGSSRSYGIDQEDTLANEGYHFVARAVNWDKKYVPFPYGWPDKHFGKIHSGQSILSRYMLSNHAVDTLDRVMSAPFFYRAFYLERLAQIAHVDVNGIEMVFMNVHLEAFDRETREKHTKYVLRRFEEYAAVYPTILVGDFNSSPDEADATIDLFLRDDNIGHAALPEGSLAALDFTYDTRQPSKRLDYIFYSKAQVELLAARVVHEAGEISDHLPVWAIFRFK